MRLDLGNGIDNEELVNRWMMMGANRALTLSSNRPFEYSWRPGQLRGLAHPRLIILGSGHSYVIGGFSLPSDFLIRAIQFGQVAIPIALTSYESRIRDLHSMMNFIFRLQPAQDRDCAFNSRLVDGNRLKSPFKCRIFSYRFAVLVRCGNRESKAR